MPRTAPQMPNGAHTPIEVWLKLDGRQLPARARNTLENLRRGWLAPECLTLGDVAALDATHIRKLPNCGRKTRRVLQESLARAGVAVAWFAPRKERGGAPTRDPVPARTDERVSVSAWAFAERNLRATREAIPEASVRTLVNLLADAFDAGRRLEAEGAETPRENVPAEVLKILRAMKGTD